jgi:hypothetical protein
VWNTRSGKATLPKGKPGAAGEQIHTDLSSVQKSCKAVEFSLQFMIKDFVKGKTQHVISMEGRDHGSKAEPGPGLGLAPGP